MVSQETLRDMQDYLDRTHPAQREQKKPETVGEVSQAQGFKPYYIDVFIDRLLP